MYLNESFELDKDKFLEQISRRQEFLKIINKEEEVKNIKKSLINIYNHNTFPRRYKENQINKLNKIERTFRNTFSVTKAAIEEIKKVGELNFNWNSLEDTIKNYQCDPLFSTSNSYLNTFYKSWMRKTPTNKKIQNLTTWELKDYLNISENFSTSKLRGDTINKFANILPSFEKELSQYLKLINVLEGVANNVDKKINDSTLKNKLKKSNKKLKTKLDKIHNKRIQFLRERNNNLEENIIEFLEKSKNSISDSEILKIAKSQKEYQKRKELRDKTYSNLNKRIKESEKEINNSKNLLDRRKINEAETSLEKTIEINPKSPKAYYNLAICKIHNSNKSYFNKPEERISNNLKEGLELIKKARKYSIGETESEKSDIYSLLSYIIYVNSKRRKDFKLNIEEVDELINTSMKINENSLANYTRGMIEFENENDEDTYLDAFENFEKVNIDEVNKINPKRMNKFELEKMKLLSLYNGDKKSEGKKILEELLSKKREGDLFRIKSRILEIEGRKKEALTFAKKSIKLNEKNIKKYKKHPEALKYYTKLSDMDYIQAINVTEGKQKERIKEAFNQMKEKGKFKKVRWIKRVKRFI